MKAGYKILRALVILAFWGLTQGLFVDRTFDTRAPAFPAYTQGFGFLKDGTLQVSIEKDLQNDAEQWFLLCTINEISMLFSYGNDACLIINNSTCTYAVPFTSSLNIPQYNVPSYGQFYTEILNCQKQQFQARLHMVFLNPDQDHLGYGYMPYPSLFTVLLFVWGFVTFVWCFNWIRFRSQPSKLNRFLTILPVVKFCYCVSGILYWRTDSEFGEVSDDLEYSYAFAIILEEAVFYAVLIVISSGWGIMKEKLGPEKYVIIGVTVGLIGSRLLGYFIHQLFFLLSFLACLVIVVLVVRFVNINLRVLYLQMRDNPTPITTDGTLRNLSAEQDKKLKSFKGIILSFIAFIMIIFLFQLLFLRDYPWSTDMLRELLDLMAFITIGYTFRLQDYSEYFILEDEEDGEESEAFNRSGSSLN